MAEKGSGQSGRPPYLGSVPFFRHAILVTLALMILIPTGLSVAFGLEAASLRDQVAELRQGLPLPAPLPSAAAEVQPAAPTPVPTPRPRVELPSYQALFPALYAPAADHATVDEEKTVYLTFDDGPSARTPEVLEILERYGAKATFFVVGQEDEQSRQWMRDIVAAGHTLGMHSYSHEYREIYASPEAFLRDMDRIHTLVGDVTGQPPSLFRFPGGSINGYNSNTYQAMISEMIRRGFVYFDWNVSAEDTKGTGCTPAEVLTDYALRDIAFLRRAVVLMHDSAEKRTTVEALPGIIEGYQDAGFTFAALTPEVVPVVYTYPE